MVLNAFTIEEFVGGVAYFAVSIDRIELNANISNLAHFSVVKIVTGYTLLTAAVTVDRQTWITDAASD